MTDEYKANEYYRQAQRFVYPLYKKDGRGGFIFSSTATLLTYKGQYFCVFAAHALSCSEESVDNIGFITTNFDFLSLSASCMYHKIYRDADIVICVSDSPFGPRNHFELAPQPSATKFQVGIFFWIGFPQKKAIQIIHESKATPDALAKHFSVTSDGRPKWNNAKFLIVGAEVASKQEKLITGRFHNKEISYEYEGYKSNGYSLRGMSGGPLFHPPQKLASEPKDLGDFFLFAGIGLEYDGAFIKGIPKDLVISLVEDALNDPVTFSEPSQND